MMDHCLGLGSGCVSVSMPGHAAGDQGCRIRYVPTNICMEAANICTSVYVCDLDTRTRSLSQSQQLLLHDDVPTDL